MTATGARSYGPVEEAVVRAVVPASTRGVRPRVRTVTGSHRSS
ncbi:hypothetical protein [Streptomyces sp. NPDC096030]